MASTNNQNKKPKSQNEKSNPPLNKTNSKRKVNVKPQKKIKRAPSGANITWEATTPPKEQPKYSKQQLYLTLGGIFLLFLFILYAFVDERQPIVPEKTTVKNQNVTKEASMPRKDFAFEHSHLYNSTQLLNIVRALHEDEEMDRILMVVFDDSTKDDSGGDALKVKLFRKFESVAKSLPRKPQFKKYEENDLPLILAFDCGGKDDAGAEQVCQQLIRKQTPNVLIFRPRQQPRPLPSEYKSDNQIITYLYNLMQPAIQFLEESRDVEHFVADDSNLNVVLFGEETTGAYGHVADALRDFARFGRSKNTAALETFDAPLNSIYIWRTFGNNPLVYPGNNISDAQSVYNFIMNNYVPIFGEFTPLTSRKYMKRGLPIFWIAYDSNHDDNAQIFAVAEEIANRFIGRFSFVQLNVRAQPELAKNFEININGNKKKTSDDGDEENKNKENDENNDDDNNNKNDDDDKKDNNEESDLPQIFIMNQLAQIRETIDKKNIEESIFKVIQDYALREKIAKGGDASQESDEPFDPSEFEENDIELENDVQPITQEQGQEQEQEPKQDL